jgi:hypothetical protein
LPVPVPEVVAVFEPSGDYPERWSVVRWINGEHPEVIDVRTTVDPRREDLAADLAAVLAALHGAQVPAEAVSDPALRWYRGEPLATMDQVTRENIKRCRSLEGFDLDLGAAGRIWDDAMRLPGAADPWVQRSLQASVRGGTAGGQRLCQPASERCRMPGRWDPRSGLPAPRRARRWRPARAYPRSSDNVRAASWKSTAAPCHRSPCAALSPAGRRADHRGLGVLRTRQAVPFHRSASVSAFPAGEVGMVE